MELASNGAVEPPIELASDVEGDPWTGMPENVSSVPNSTERVGEHIDGQTVAAGCRGCQARLNGNELRLGGGHSANRHLTH